jgi:hypothetical protein
MENMIKSNANAMIFRLTKAILLPCPVLQFWHWQLHRSNGKIVQNTGGQGQIALASKICNPDQDCATV